VNTHALDKLDLSTTVRADRVIKVSSDTTARRLLMREF